MLKLTNTLWTVCTTLMKDFSCDKSRHKTPYYKFNCWSASQNVEANLTLLDYVPHLKKDPAKPIARAHFHRAAKHNNLLSMKFPH